MGGGASIFNLGLTLPQLQEQPLGQHQRQHKENHQGQHQERHQGQHQEQHQGQYQEQNQVQHQNNLNTVGCELIVISLVFLKKFSGRVIQLDFPSRHF